MEEDKAPTYDYAHYYGSVVRRFIMADIGSSLAQLITAVKETQEFHAYNCAKENVKQFPELKAQIDEFRIRNFEIQNLTNESELFYIIEEFEREYESFRENPLVEEFLKAEVDLCRMMQNINTQLTTALEFD